MPNPVPSKNSVKADHAQLYEKLVAELADFAVFLMDTNGQVVSWNPGVEKILGFKKADWLGKPIEIIFTPEDRAQNAHKQEITKATREGRSPDIRWHVKQNGERLFVDGILVALRDEAGQLLGYSKVMRDITARKEAEIKLQQQWQTFDAALSHIPDLVYIVDRQGRFTYLNQSLLTLWRKPREELLGKTFYDLGFPPDIAEQVHNQFQQVISTERTLRDNTQYTGQSGETRDYDYIFSPVFGTDGRVEGVVSSTRDITESNRLVRALAESKETLQQIFLQAPVAILVLRGKELIVELANPPYQALFKGRKLLGRQFADIPPRWDKTFGSHSAECSTRENHFLQANGWFHTIPMETARWKITGSMWFSIRCVRRMARYADWLRCLAKLPIR